MPVHIETISAISFSPMETRGSRRRPLAPGLLELAALQGELLSLSLRPRGPLELLAVYGGLFLGADLAEISSSSSL